MPSAVLCQGLAVCGTFPNLLAEFAPVHTDQLILKEMAQKNQSFSI